MREIAAVNRPLLLRIAVSASAAELDRASQAALDAGFDGVDLHVGTGVDAGWAVAVSVFQRPSPYPLPAGEGGLAGVAFALMHPSPRAPEIGANATASTARIGAVSTCCESGSVENEVPRVARLLRCAAETGATVLNLSIPHLADPGDGPSAANRQRQACFARYQDTLNFTYELLHRLRLEAEAAGVALAVEAPACGALLSPVELRETIDAANSWAVGACVDCDRVAKIGESPADWLATLGHRVHAVRLPSSEVPSPHLESAALRNALARVPADRPLIAGTLDANAVRAWLAGSSQTKP